MPGYRINPSNRIVFAFVFGCTRAKNLQLELQRQRPADSDQPVSKHLYLSPATTVGVISAGAVQRLCHLTVSVLHEETLVVEQCDIRVRALVIQANRESRPVLPPGKNDGLRGAGQTAKQAEKAISACVFWREMMTGSLVPVHHPQ